MQRVSKGGGWGEEKLKRRRQSKWGKSMAAASKNESAGSEDGEASRKAKGDMICVGVVTFSARCLG